MTWAWGELKNGGIRICKCGEVTLEDEMHICRRIVVADELPFMGVAELSELHDNRVTFRFGIDEEWPETVVINITKERWERMGKPTELAIDVSK